eukprot:CAMPEP_0179235440 /NCGR_PEP_ID=MMETSP0797-20121207/13412_1 /TAXON_ID=47934 /ORGANISM="Dinophysis acuminata, Strain DAEP01" /LENGTH=298 /DNA_ID=CAMNT_0020942663 /DNA_START=214 /DNA_END=1108 /DNA_ORIENTATION=+
MSPALLFAARHYGVVVDGRNVREEDLLPRARQGHALRADRHRRVEPLRFALRRVDQVPVGGLGRDDVHLASVRLHDGTQGQLVAPCAAASHFAQVRLVLPLGLEEDAEEVAVFLHVRHGRFPRDRVVPLHAEQIVRERPELAVAVPLLSFICMPNFDRRPSMVRPQWPFDSAMPLTPDMNSALAKLPTRDMRRVLLPAVGPTSFPLSLLELTRLLPTAHDDGLELITSSTFLRRDDTRVTSAPVASLCTISEGSRLPRDATGAPSTSVRIASLFAQPPMARAGGRGAADPGPSSCEIL